MSSAPNCAPRDPGPPRGRKRCPAPPRGCGLEKDLAEFYAHHVIAKTGHVVLGLRCKSCANLVRRGKAVFRAVTLGDRIDQRVLVMIHVEPAFIAPPPEPGGHFPCYDTTPLCPRGNHEWPTERVCRGYEALGCGGYGPHIHRRCISHAVEETESLPRTLGKVAS